MRRRAITVLAALLLAGLVGTPPAQSAACPEAAAPAGPPRWPPPPEPGAFDFAHFGEGHWNEGQGPKTMPVLVQELIAHRPRFVAFSSDMADVGLHPQLECFRSLMAPLLEAGIPWFDSPGNHDRTALGPGGVVTLEIGPWREVFAGMPRPWGDGPHPGPGFVLPEGEPDDGPGASTHYYLDYGPPGSPALRLIVLDNSRHSFTLSDPDQYPAVGPGQRDPSQFGFLVRTALEARDRGLLTFVLMHQPTQDPRDITNAHPVSYNHTMSKGASPDNQLFDLLALATGVDGVLIGHIQGNVVYAFPPSPGCGLLVCPQAQVQVPYFVDGGGGGSPYALREVGTDTGYFYGFRLFRVFPAGGGWGYRTYFIPLVDRIEVSTPAGPLAVGQEVQLAATALQPFDPSLPGRFSLLPNEQIRLQLRPPDPSRVDAATVPHLAYMWSSSDPGVLAPVPGPDDPAGDPAFDPGRMTTSGRFRAVGSGQATVTIATGTHAAQVEIEVQ